MSRIFQKTLVAPNKTIYIALHLQYIVFHSKVIFKIAHTCLFHPCEVYFGQAFRQNLKKP